MQTYILFGGPEQFRHLLLGQPDRLVLKSYLQAHTVIWLIKNDLALLLTGY